MIYKLIGATWHKTMDQCTERSIGDSLHVFGYELFSI
jgi:hypothetical protein